MMQLNQFNAAWQGDVQWFEENDYDINKHHPGTGTSLMFASESGRKEVCLLLLSKGASIYEQDSHGQTALMYASKRGYKEICSMLLSKGALIDKQNNYGRTALMIASGNGRKDACLLLLSHGASTDKYDSNGQSALIIAASNGHEEVFKLLQTFSKTPRTLKYHVLKTKPICNNKMLLQWNNYEKEIKCHYKMRLVF